MIDIPRSLLRQFRAVLRRSGSPLDPQREVPAVRCRTGAAGLALEAVRAEIALRCQAEGSRPEVTLTFPASLLAQVEGRKDDPVTLERVSDTTGRARWNDDGVPRVAEFELMPPDSVPAFPEVPRRFTSMPPEFGPALAEAIRSTARDSVRYCADPRADPGQGRLPGWHRRPPAALAQGLQVSVERRPLGSGNPRLGRQGTAGPGTNRAGANQEPCGLTPGAVDLPAGHRHRRTFS